MGIERLNFSEKGPIAVAVAIGRINAPPHNTHTGVVYRDRDGLRMIHLGWHHQLHHWEWKYEDNYAHVIPEIPRERANAVAALCRLVRRKPRASRMPSGWSRMSASTPPRATSSSPGRPWPQLLKFCYYYISASRNTARRIGDVGAAPGGCPVAAAAPALADHDERPG